MPGNVSKEHQISGNCTELLEKLHACRDENRFSKFLGTCNDAFKELNQCLQKEYEDKREANHVKALQMRERKLGKAKASPVS